MTVNLRMYRLYCGVKNEKNTILIFLACLSGLILGTVFANFAGNAYIGLLVRSVSTPVSFAGLCISAVLPILLAVFLERFGFAKYLWMLCFWKAFLLGACSFGCYLAFGSGGWLVRMLLQFSDLLLFPVLVWLCLRSGKGKNGALLQMPWVCIVIAVAVCFIDFAYISPFVSALSSL